MLYQIFFPPQVKRIAIISNKHGMYEFPHELPNDLRLKAELNRSQNLQKKKKICWMSQNRVG